MSFIIPLLIVGGIIYALCTVLAPYLAIAYNIAIFIYWLLNTAIKFLTTPFKLLAEWLSDLLFRSRKFSNTFDKLDYKFDAMGGCVPFFLFLASLLFVLVYILFLVSGSMSATTIENIFFNTTVGSFFTLINSGFSFSPGVVLTAAFASLFAHLCIDKASETKWYVWIPYCIVFICMSTILAMLLSSAFDSFGTWGYNTIIALATAKTAIFWKILGFIPLILLGYLAITVIVITVREYFCSVVFGVAALLGLGVIAFAFQQVFGTAGWINTAFGFLFIAVIISVEKIRCIADDKLAEDVPFIDD